jgi:hypothetical protein
MKVVFKLLLRGLHPELMTWGMYSATAALMANNIHWASC